MISPKVPTFQGSSANNDNLTPIFVHKDLTQKGSKSNARTSAMDTVSLVPTQTSTTAANEAELPPSESVAPESTSTPRRASTKTSTITIARPEFISDVDEVDQAVKALAELVDLHRRSEPDEVPTPTVGDN